MGFFRRKQTLVAVALIVLLCVGALLLLGTSSQPTTVVPEKKHTDTKHEVIGHSVEGRPIESYTYGTGGTHLVFVGGIHGGYEWNSVLLAYQFMDYLEQNPTTLPANISVSVIPSANPDAVYAVAGKEGQFLSTDVTTDKEALAVARFNANKVDLNRNFDCKWQPKSTWQSKSVSAGTSAFSEPEAVALRDFFLAHTPDAVVFWHSQAGAVYASECGQGILPKTTDIMNVYAKASGYKPIPSFDAYAVTGAAEDWLASLDIPAITVELKIHESVEWEENLAGSKALLDYYTPKSAY